MSSTVASLPARLIELADFAEQTDNGDLMPNGGDEARCVFVNMRPEDFDSLIREAAAALASPAIPASYNRELIARMLFDYSNISGGRYEAQSARKQAQLISEADNATGEAVTVNRSPAMAGSAGEELADRLDRYCAKWDAQVQWSGNDMAALLQDAGEAADLIHRLATPEQPGSAVQGEVVAYRLWNGNGWDYSQRPFPGYAAQPLYTTPPPAPAAEQGQCNHDEADVCPKCELRWRSLTERPAATQPEARGVEGMVREAIKICSSFNTPQDMADYLNDELRSLAATPNPVRAEQPEGERKLLPVEPTAVMRAAGKDAHYEAEKAVEDGGNENFARFGLRENRVMHVYAAMLAAAPAAPGAGVDEAMLSRACAAYVEDGRGGSRCSYSAMKSALIAALAGKEGA